MPQGYKANPQLAKWVNNQRAEYKKHMEGKYCKITQERIEKLRKIEFQWKSKGGKKPTRGVPWNSEQST